MQGKNADFMGIAAMSGAAVAGVSVQELNWRILSKGRITTRSSGRESREWVGVGKWRYEEKNIACPLRPIAVKFFRGRPNIKCRLVKGLQSRSLVMAERRYHRPSP